FYETAWDVQTVYLEREIYADFNPESAVKTWKFTLKTDQLAEPLTISVSENYNRNTEKLYLLNTSNSELVDLTQDSMTVYPQNDDYIDFRLIWGDLMPTAYFITQDNRIYREGDIIEFNWYINYPAMIREIDLFLLGNSDSLLISAGLPGDADHYEWQVPSNLELHNLRPVMDIYTEHSEQIRRMASYYLGMVPTVTVLSVEANHQLLSDPWTDFIIYPDFLLGNNDIYSYLPETGYQAAGDMSFGTGYWLTSDYEQNLFSDAQIWQDNYSVFLEPGWNLIANPHLCSYQYYDLKFMYVTANLNFSQAVTESLIVNNLYELANGSYQVLNTIPAMKSFLIYANAGSGIPLQCIFRPYNHSFYIAPTPDWTIRVTASQEGIDSDDLTLGAGRQTTADFDYDFDIPEPPCKPYIPSLSFYFPKDTAVDTLFLYEKLDREFKSALDSNLPDSECWFFTMEVASLEPITISADYTNTPAGYWSRMYLEEEILPLIENEPVTFSPSATGSLSGEIWVYNHYFNAADNPLKPINLNVYPNPFNPTTTISYQLPPECYRAVLNIYNVRGQLIKAFIIDHTAERSGKHRGNSIIWNGEDINGKKVASGLYFVSLEAGNLSFHKKMVLIK
ncbi:MAG: T9SS type A sorting domain-containing protein, partial [Candidatus Cloacimonetes bacterium]|nr:T9SS type A sorting domain-containing protein [Candidatus Cloacimonadota bacterium]